MFPFEAKRKNRKRNEVKRKIFGSETKRKYAVLILFWSEAKNSKQKEAKGSEKNYLFSRERVKRMRTGCRFALKENNCFFKQAHPNPEQTFSPPLPPD